MVLFVSATAVSSNDSRSYVKNSPSLPKLLHCWGNHDIYLFERSFMFNSPLHTAAMLDPRGPAATTASNYYRVDLTAKVSLIALDLFEYAVLERGDHAKRNASALYIAKVIQFSSLVFESATKVHKCTFSNYLKPE